VRSLNLSNFAADFLTTLESKQSRQIWNKIVSLMKDARPNDSIDLDGEFFRTSIGEFRIVYKFDKSILYIVLVGRRNDDEIYKQFKRR
jgi:mRNA interferase RelE/StbE